MPFNPAQMEAIHHQEGPCMVLAGPGSGKTTVLTERLVVLTKQHHIDPKHILVVTFTKAAAKEMRDRYLKKSQSTTTNITFGTFHSVFFSILKMHYSLQESNILSERDKIRILEEVFEDENIGMETDTEFLVSVLTEISLVKNNMLNPAEYVSQNPRIPFAKIFHLYEKRVRQRNAIDFDDMLTMTYQLFTTRPDVCAFWQNRFLYVMVDEFQDINVLQYKIIQLLAYPQNNLFIVGDDDQSIYRFRGAEPGIMLRFPHDYPKTVKIYLDINYRSGKNIVKESLFLIKNNKKRYEKKLQAEREETGEVLLREFKTEQEESQAVVENIRTLAESNLAYDEIAVLFRTNSSASLVLQQMADQKIPFFAKDQIQNIFQNPFTRGILAYLNWVIGERNRSNFLKMMNAPNRYIRREDLKAPMISLEDLKRQYAENEMRKWMVEKIEWLEYQMNMLYRLRTPYAMINYIRYGIGYDDYVKDCCEERKADPATYLTILDEVMASAASYKTIESWYEHIANFTKELQKQREEGKEDKKNKVFVSSLHGSKGLEFSEVFILDVNEKVIPHERAREEEDIEEERRIFYVGMTRAKKTLHLYSVKERFGKKMERSRFLKEL